MFRKTNIKTPTKTPVNTADNQNDWQRLETACLDISLFNRYQEGEYLRSTLLWINGRFTKCILNLGDTLHRYNLRGDHPSMIDAHKAAFDLGARWLADNAQYFKELSIPYRLIRSNDWLKDKDFPPIHEALWDYYYKDTFFQAVVKEDIEAFVARKPETAAEITRKASLPYLLEETAADILLGSRGGVTHLYPGSRHACYWYLIENSKNLPKILRGLEQSAFKRLSPSRLAQKASQTIPQTTHAETKTTTQAA